jgi:hypothetical protein
VCTSLRQVGVTRRAQQLRHHCTNYKITSYRPCWTKSDTCAAITLASSQRYALRGRSLKVVRLRLASNTPMHNACMQGLAAACKVICSRQKGIFYLGNFVTSRAKGEFLVKFWRMLLPRIREKEREGRRQVSLLVLDFEANTSDHIPGRLFLHHQFEMWGSCECIF